MRSRERRCKSTDSANEYKRHVLSIQITTYHADHTNENIGRGQIIGDHLRDEVCGHANNRNETHGLEDPDNLECCAQRAILVSSHNDGYARR